MRFVCLILKNTKGKGDSQKKEAHQHFQLPSSNRDPFYCQNWKGSQSHWCVRFSDSQASRTYRMWHSVQRTCPFCKQKGFLIRVPHLNEYLYHSHPNAVVVTNMCLKIKQIISQCLSAREDHLCWAWRLPLSPFKSLGWLSNSNHIQQVNRRKSILISVLGEVT